MKKVFPKQPSKAELLFMHAENSCILRTIDIYLQAVWANQGSLLQAKVKMQRTAVLHFQ
jgi:hypothetical protein